MAEEDSGANQPPPLRTREPLTTADHTASMVDLLTRMTQGGPSAATSTQTTETAEDTQTLPPTHTTSLSQPADATNTTGSPMSGTATERAQQTEQARQTEQGNRPLSSEMAGVMNILLRRLDDINRGTTTQFAALNQANQACHNRITELQDGMRTQDRRNPGAADAQNRLPGSRDARNEAHHDPATAHLRELETLRATVEQMNSKMHQAISSAPEIDRVLREAQNTPFTERISRTPVRHADKIRLPTYAGGADPSQHLTAFSIAMGRAHFLPAEEDAGKCQLFVESLTDDALTWFSRLETHSIDSYQELSTAFLTPTSGTYPSQTTSRSDLTSTASGASSPRSRCRTEPRFRHSGTD